VTDTASVRITGGTPSRSPSPPKGGSGNGAPTSGGGTG
jgi:hypothetical protein